MDLHDHTPTARGRAFMWGGILLGVLFVVIVYTHGFGLFSGNAHPAQDSGAPVHKGDAIFIPEGSALRTRVAVQAAVAQPVSPRLLTPGIVESDPAVTAMVLAPLSGRVVELPVELGARVTRGQVVAVLDSPDLGQAHDDNDKAADALALATRNLERQEQQFKIGVISDRDLDQARSDHAQAQSEATRTQARLAALGAGAADSNPPGRLLVRAPVTGSVTTLTVARGNMLNDATQPLMTIADLSTVWVTALVAEKDLESVKVGQDAQVTLSAYPDQLRHGRVTSVSDVIEPDSRRDKVRIALPNPDYALRPNMFAAVTLLGPGHSQVIVPTSALLMNNDRTSVFVATAPWTFKRRVVDMRLGEGATAVILGGVAAGEQVVVKGGILLMIDQFVAFCLHQRVAVILLALLLSGFGVYAWETLSVEAYPELGDVAAQVTTQVPGLAAEEVEQLITVPLERQINGTPGLLLMRSSSTFGLSLITVLFRDGYEDYWARQRLLERINQAVLPPGASPALDPVAGPGGEIYRYTLESDTRNLQELSEIQRWVVIPAMKSVPGVVDDTNFGGFTTEYQLNLNPQQLQHYGIGITDVINAINNNNANAGGGRVSRGEQSFVVRGVGLLHDLAGISSLVVTQVNGVPVRIGDLGQMVLSHQEREGILGKDKNPDTIEGIVLMLKYQNPSLTLKGVHAKVAQLNAQLAAEGVRIVPYIDRDDLVHETISKVGHTIAEGIALVFLILIVFLGNPRSALVVAVTIPLALVAVFSLLNLTHVSANLLSLGAIDFGILVDGAIVVTEAILRRREAMPDEELSESEVRAATLQVTRPIFFASLIIITAYLPLFSFERAEAKLFTPMAYTMGYALFGALLTTLTLVPGLAYFAFRAPGRVYHNRWLEKLTDFYDRILANCLAQPRIIYGVIAFALLAVFALGGTIGREFLPDLDEGALWLQVQLPTGISLDKASDMASDLRRAILKHPEVSYAVTQTGRNDDGTDPWTMSHIEAPVGLKAYDSWPDHESKKAFLDRLSTDLARDLPEFSVGISQPIIDGVNDLIGGAHSPLVVKIYGDDLDELRRVGRQIVGVLYTVRGTSSASLFQEPPIPQIEIKLDHDKAARYGLNMTDVQNVVQTGIGQAPVSTVYVGERTYPLTVRFDEAARASAAAIGNLPVTTISGAQVPLDQVAAVRERMGESTVTRENGQRNLTIGIDNRDRDLTSYLQEAQAKIAAQVHFDPRRVRIEWGGQFENQRRAESRLLIILGLVMGLMLIFLTIGTHSFRQALLILSVVPLATLGGLISLHLTGQHLNVATGVGFIALFGVAVQNGIIMVSNLNRMRKSGLELHEAIMKGATERLRPVLMTAMVASLGMLPAAIHTGVGSDVQRGIATVVVGGLLVSTVLTLIVLPAMYHVIEHWAESRGGKAAWQSH